MLIPVLAEQRFVLYKNFLPGGEGMDLGFWICDLGFSDGRVGIGEALHVGWDQRLSGRAGPPCWRDFRFGILGLGLGRTLEDAESAEEMEPRMDADDTEAATTQKARDRTNLPHSSVLLRATVALGGRASRAQIYQVPIATTVQCNPHRQPQESASRRRGGRASGLARVEWRYAAARPLCRSRSSSSSITWQ